MRTPPQNGVSRFTARGFHPRGARSESGFTQLELILGMILISVLLLGITALLRTGMGVYGEGSLDTELDRSASRVVERITDAISTSGADVVGPRISPPGSGTRITVQKNEGWSGGAIVWGSPIVFEYRPDPKDPPDGKDNNGNGLIDEGMVVMRVNAGQPDERDTILTRWVRSRLEGEKYDGKDDNGNGLVDERGFCVDVQGNLWTIRLTLERYDNQRRLVTRTVETSIRPRN